MSEDRMIYQRLTVFMMGGISAVLVFGMAKVIGKLDTIIKLLEAMQ